jgi:uncharacterized protein (DUF934 family)
MSALLRLVDGAPQFEAALPEGAFKPAPAPFPTPTLPLLNAGQGDARTKTKPNVAQAQTPVVLRWEHGTLLPLPELLATPHLPPKAGVVLMPTDDPIALADRISALALIAIEFPRAADGRGLSTARLVRDRLGWRGELRAVGEVLIDQLFYMARCGFDAFALRGDQNQDAALRAFSTFPDVYQDAADERTPLYLRRRPA